jgi:tetratricopeptide (TPR) repeat protein
MSYINDALRKAQQDKDSRYDRYSGIISQLPGPRRPGRSKWIIAVVAMMLIPAAIYIWLETAGHTERPVAFSRKTSEKIAVDRQAHTGPKAPETTTAKVESSESTGGATQAAGAAEAAAVGRQATVMPLPDTEPLYREALAAQRKKKTAMAEQLYRRILSINAQHVESMNNLGVLLMAQKRQDEAIALFRGAITIKMDYADPYYNLACLYAQRNEADRSIQYLKSAIAIDRHVIDWAKTDKDLAHIRELESFKTLLENN